MDPSKEMETSIGVNDQRMAYEPPMLSNIGDYSELTTGCGFNFFEAPAQHSNCSNW
ncbi:lasso RiPP family leader peptide-containing protein [Saccharopolyspora gloriosae]|uniref:lasso RiPP family leader peptide-containing protein n=1 Tax=Saccharopolyspora gloriosae TaxID=455344 RepID=UPI001FB82C4F|nr:lasso RiPP family leader peptide-containing protein [Saccharopolyspora gloriosae]